MAPLIAILSVFVVAGAFMWMQPSKRDKHLSKLRSSAITNGFLIGSIKLPDTSEYGRVNQVFQIQTLYQRSLEIQEETEMSFTALRTTGEHGIYLPEGWDWNHRKNLQESQYQSIAAFLKELPQSVSAIVLTKNTVGLVWDEKDPDMTLEQIKSLLIQAAESTGQQTK